MACLMLPASPRCRARLAGARWPTRRSLCYGPHRARSKGYMDDRSEAWQESQKAEALQEVKEAILEAFFCAEAIDI